MSNWGSDTDPLHTIKVAAERLYCSERTVRREISRGNLLIHRIGPAKRLVRIRESEIQRYLRDCET